MGQVYGPFADKQERKDAGTSISRFLLGAAILFLGGVIWRTAVLGLILGLLTSTILLSIALFSPPLSSETGIGSEARLRRNDSLYAIL